MSVCPSVRAFLRQTPLLYIYLETSSNARLRPEEQHPGNSLITQIIDLQTLFAINDRQTVQTETQTDRQVAFKGRDYSRKYPKMRLMVGEAEGGVDRSRTVCIERSL